MLQAKILQHFGELPSPERETITRTYVQYSCRCCTSDRFSQLYRLDLATDQREAIRTVKSWIDYSCYRNELYHATWMLAQYQKPQYRVVSKQHGLDPDELRILFRLLYRPDIEQLRSVPEPAKFSSRQINLTVDAVNPSIRKLTKRYLRYVYQNDGGYSKEDFWADLVVQAVRVIRNYEVLGLTIEQMVPLVARGISNHAKNLASHKGKDRRNPLVRVQKGQPYRTAWYCNIGAERVEACRVYTSPEHRKGEYCLAEFPNRPRAFVYCRRLFGGRDNAEAALLRYRRGQDQRRDVLVDLTNETADDWQPATASLETPSHQDGAPLLAFLPDPNQPSQFSIDNLLRDIKNPRARMFCHAVLGDLGPMFDQHCRRQTGKSSAELTSRQLSQIAQKYCGISLTELTEATKEVLTN